MEFLGQMVMPQNASKLLALGLREGPKVYARPLMGAETGRGATLPNHVKYLVPVKLTGQGGRQTDSPRLRDVQEKERFGRRMAQDESG